jgi:hypothetical protein
MAMVTGAAVLGTDGQAQLAREGFVVLPGLLSPAAVARSRATSVG